MQTSTIQSILRIFSFLISAIILYHTSTISVPSVYFHGVTIPISNDSFYHLKRIVETVNAYPSISDFDPDIYAPEGTWLTWPKGFDFLMATIAKLILTDYSKGSIAYLICSIPPYIGLISLFLLYIILRLVTDSIWVHITTLFIYAFSPLTLTLHSVGIVDHHSFEHLFVLLSFTGVLLWYKKPDSMAGPIFSGITMGVSQIFHAGLFILQLPLLLAITISCLKNEMPILKGVPSYSISLLISTILVCLSSTYLYNGMVGFYYLGWFHIYIAGLTSTYLLFLTKIKDKKWKIFIIFAVTFALAIPLLNIFIEGFAFMRLEFPEFHMPEENKNIFGFTNAGRFSFGESMLLYSGFPFLIPIIMIFNIVQCIKGKGIITVFSSFAFIFMMLFNAQFRFHQYGSIFLFISIFMLFKEADERVDKKKYIRIAYYAAITILIFTLQYTSGIFKYFNATYELAGRLEFKYIFSGLVELKKACEKKSGIVLSDMEIGHYISYYTNCRVFSNNFNQTPFQWEKTKQTKKLLKMSLEDFKKENKSIRYIFIIRSLEELSIKKGVINGSIKKEDIVGKWLKQMRNRLLYTPPEDPYFNLLSSGEPVDGSLFIGKHPFYRIYKVYLSP